MNFDLKTMSPAQAADLNADALLVLVPDELPRGDSPLHALVSQAVQGEDLEPGVGKWLACYRPAGLKAARVLLVRCGSGDSASLRKAVAAGVAQLKSPSLARLGVVLSLCAPDSQ